MNPALVLLEMIERERGELSREDRAGFIRLSELLSRPICPEALLVAEIRALRKEKGRKFDADTTPPAPFRTSRATPCYDLWELRAK